MSEYQYYEFRAVDRLLTDKQIKELRAYSSRAQISPDSFVNTYDWGDFKGDPETWMEEYFDAFLYLANWGTRMLMLRVPKRVLDLETALTYSAGDSLYCYTSGPHLILSFQSDEEEFEWVDGEGWLGFLVQLRSDLMEGDYRCLYLGWLLGVQDGQFDDDTLEPPVPPGLGSFNSQLKTLTDFLRIDPDLIAAAEESSKKESAGTLSREDISAWVAKLPSKNKDAVLMKLLEGDDSHIVATELRRQAQIEISGRVKSGSGHQASSPRTVGRLIARADMILEQREKREADRRAKELAQRERAEAEKRKKYLESLDGRESALWSQVKKLIATRQPKRYDEAVSLLKDLNELAEMTGNSSEFAYRMSVLHLEHARKGTLVERFRKADLVE